MALRSQIRDELRRVQRDWPQLPQFPRFPERVPATISAFCQDQNNRDGRGLKVSARKEVLRTLKHIRSAERRATHATVPLPLAREARKLLKSLGHNVEFERTVEQARRFAGEMQRTGKRVSMATSVCEPMECLCGIVDDVEVRIRRVSSVADLMAVGGTLDLCVAKRDADGRDYHAQLRSGETEFWSLAGRRPIALISVVEPNGQRRVSEFDGPGHERPYTRDRKGQKVELPGDLLTNLLRAIDATADDNEHFCRAGVFRSLVQDDARERRRDVVVEGFSYSVWRFATEIIIARRLVSSGDAVRSQWSRFVRSSTNTAECVGMFGRRPGRRRRPPTQASPETYEWREATWHSGSMDLGEFIALVLRSGELRAAVADHACL